MQVISLDIPEVKIISPKKFGDHRGFFSETYNKNSFSDNGLDFDFIQDNHSYSAPKGTLRGLHFQTPPFGQNKLLRVVRGEIFDVAVDLRRNSPTYGKWVGATISADKWNQILVPVGFAHGFCTLTDDVEVVYKVDALYAPDNDNGIAWNDPDIAIDWPLDGQEPILSGKDADLQSLAAFDSPFDYTP